VIRPPGDAGAGAHEGCGRTYIPRNLHTELKRLRSIGATVDGTVGDPDPMKAIDNAIARQRFDEIILSTLPPGISRWLSWDLPRRIRRRTDIPLTVVTSPRQPTRMTD
jgi:hypothetical protein